MAFTKEEQALLDGVSSPMGEVNLHQHVDINGSQSKYSALPMTLAARDGSPEETMQVTASEQDQAMQQELRNEIQQAKDPKAKAILQDEYNKSFAPGSVATPDISAIPDIIKTVAKPSVAERAKAIVDEIRANQDDPDAEREAAAADFRARTAPVSTAGFDLIAKGDAERAAQRLHDQKANKSDLADMGTSLKRGFEQLPGMLTGVADVIPALVASERPFTEAAAAVGEATGFQPGKWADEDQQQYSAKYQQEQQNIQQAWDDPNKSWLDVSAAYAKNPAYTANQIVESLPSMVAGGVGGRALMTAGRVAEGVGALAKPGMGYLEKTVGQKTAASIAGGAGEGGVQAGQQMAQYKGTDQRSNAVAAIGSGLIDAVIGAGSGQVAQKLGLETAETLMAKGFDHEIRKELSLGRRVAGGATNEVLQELPQGAQEQVWQNYADNKPLWDGVDRNSVESAIAGFAMGAGANILHGHQPAPVTPPPVKQPNSPLTNAVNAAAPHATPVVPAAVPPNTPPPADGETPVEAPAAEVAPSVVQAEGTATDLKKQYGDIASLLSDAHNIAALHQLDSTLPGQLAQVWNGVINNQEVAPQVRTDALQQTYALLSSWPQFSEGMTGNPFQRQLTDETHTQDQPVDLNAPAVPEVAPVAAPDTSALDAIRTLHEKNATLRHQSIRALIGQGFQSISKNDDGTHTLSSPEGMTLTLRSPADVQVARTAIRKIVDAKAHEAAASPLNDLTEPTDVQLEAGNYKKGHIDVHGISIAVEHPRESVRRGVSPEGKAWESTLTHHYGYIKRTEGADGEAVDVLVGPNPSSDKAFIVDQVDPATGKFDEHKTLLGFDSLEDAKQGYLSNYEPGWKGMGAITQKTIPEFKQWLKDDTTTPVGNLDAPVTTTVDQVNDTPDTQTADRSWIRPEIEALIKQKRVATVLGKGALMDKLISHAKKYMNGGDVKPAQFNLYAEGFKSHKGIASIAQRIRDTLKAANNKTVADARAKTRAATEAAKTETTTAPEVTDTPEIKQVKAERSVQRLIFNEAANADDLIVVADKDLAQFTEAAKLYVTQAIQTMSEDGDISSVTVDRLPNEFWAALHRRTQRLASIAAKEKNRDPSIYKDVLAKAIVEAGIELEDQDALDSFKEGFDHALKGKSKSTLSSGIADTKIDGYEKAWEWVRTEDGKAWYEGERKRKLQDTGADLRRWFDLANASLKDLADSDPIKVLAFVKKLTERAKVFDLHLAEDATPGAQAFADHIRSKIRTFNDWVTTNGGMSGLSGDTWQKGDEQKIANFLSGSAYVFGKENGSSEDWTAKQRAEYLTDQAAAWLAKLQPVVEALSGAKTVADIADKMQTYSQGEGEYSTYSPQGEELTYRLMVRRATADDFWPDKSITRQYIATEGNERTANRSKPLTPPRLDKITRKGFDDHRQGRDVTPQEFKDTFNFADVGFGKWVGAKKDQDHLNYAYDALMDLSQQVGCDPKDIGFRGKLYFTIGALGHGKYAAHFAASQQHPDGGTVEVINLTNTRGDGTVAHEWFHALDFYLGGGVMSSDPGVKALVSRLSDAYDYERLNEVPVKFLEQGWVYPHLKKRHATKLEHAEYAIQHGDYGRQSRTQYKIDADTLAGSGQYWNNQRELLARAAEAWMFDALGEKKNSYLVNDWVADGVVSTEQGYRGRPYPTADERKRFAIYFDAFVKAIDWTATGPVMDLERLTSALPDEAAEFNQARTDLLAQLPEIWARLQAEHKAREHERINSIEANDSAAQKAIEDQRRRDDLRRQLTAESIMSTADKPVNTVTDGPLSRDELEALFDEAESELAEESMEQPDAQNPGDNLAAVNGPASADLNTGHATPVEKESAGRMAAEFAKLGVKGIDEALIGLVKLFGSGNGKLNSFPAGFDPAAYDKAKPHFEAALKAFVEAGKTLKDLLKALIQQFGPGVRPYAIKFAEDQSLGLTLTKEVTQDVPDAHQAGSDDRSSDEGQLAGDVSPTVGGGESEASGSGEGERIGGNLRYDLQSGANADTVAGEPGLHDAGARPANGGTSGERGSAESGNRVPDGRADYTAPNGSLTRQGSWRETARRNLDIIELVKKLDAEGRLASPAEQSLIAKFTGWGASELRNSLFPVRNNGGRQQMAPDWAKAGWEELAQRAVDLMTQEEIDTALQSTQYAHYTAEGVIRSIWHGLDRLGFSGGRMFEPGAGIGLFAVAAPKHVMDKSRYTGVEMDHLSADIAKHLLQKENIIQADFVKQRFPDNFFDLAIGNPPFSDIRIKDDPAYKKHGFMLHDYFFAKSIDKVRPGGLLVFVTSHGTMDKKADKARQYIADRADLLGAIRMPQTAFRENAGTEVVTDVLFLRKRVPGQEKAGEGWMNLAEITTAEGQKHLVNQYFDEHPEMVLGSHSTTGSMYRSNEYTVLPLEGNIEDQFAQAITKLPAGVYVKAVDAEATKAETIERDFNPKAKKEGSVYVTDSGKLMRLENGAGVPLSSVMKLSASEEAWMKDYAGLRDALKQAQYDQLNDGEWEKSLKALNKSYDAFVKKHGQISEFTVYDRTTKDEDGNPIITEYRRYRNNRMLKSDIEGSLIRVMERITEDGQIVKAPILLDRTIKRPLRPEIRNLQDALMVSLDEQGRLNLDHVAEMAKISRAEVINTLGDLVFESPSGEWQMADEYLSGDVLEKLDEAEQAAKLDPRYERNVKALLLAQPRPLAAAQISVPLGANWVPETVVTRFATDVLGIFGDVSYNPLTNVWTVPSAGGAGSRRRRTAWSDWGSVDMSPYEMLDSVLNARQIKITHTHEVDGKDVSYTDPAATAALNEIAKKMRKAFGNWVWTDSVRAEQLAALYNRKFNNIAPRVFDGRHLTLPGLSLRYKLFDHQKRAIWRVIQAGNTYLAHAVGAGKTLEMIVSGMEQRRLGLIHKPMYVVPNNMLEQWASDFLDAYPTANIMVADEDNFGADNRRRFVSQAALNNPDAIIITHSAFGLIRTQQKTNDVVVNEIIMQLQAAAEEEGDRRKRAKIEKQIENIKRKFDSKVEADKKDNQITFEELGVDYLYVDEAHKFRKLDFATNRQSIKGVNPNGSQQALDLFIKARWLNSQRPGRSLVMASGTPVTNTMAELFSVMRFMMPQELEKIGLDHFDAWANMFGVVASDYEMNAAGKYEVVERFSKFVNVPELMKRVRMFMDVLVSSHLGTLVKRPSMMGGVPTNEVVPPSDKLLEYLRVTLSDRIDTSRKWRPSPGEKGNPDPLLNIITDGRLSAIDMRFIDSSLPNDPGSKLNVMIDNIIDRHNKYKDNEYIDNATGKPDSVKGATQIIFSAVGFGDQVAITRGFDAKAWIAKRLKEAGITNIAFMGDYNTAAKKENLFNDMRAGKVKQLYGSPANMGVGVNVQKRLKVLHYLSPPWFPADVEQPMGRIERQGNQNAEIEALWYATKGTYDATAWSMNARKARFIEQAFTGDDSIRSMEDVSESSQYEMASALAAGDERAIQLAGYKADIERLSRLKEAHAQTQMQLLHDKAEFEFRLRNMIEREANLAEGVKQIGGYIYGDALFVEINGTKLQKRTDIGDAIIRNANAAIQMWKAKSDYAIEEVEIGKSQGKLPIVAQLRRDFASGKVNQRINVASLYVKVGPLDFPIEEVQQVSYSEFDPSGLATRLNNAINNVDRKHTETESMISSIKAELNLTTSKIGAPFPEERELNDKIADSARLQEEMAKGGDEIPSDEALLAMKDAQEMERTTKLNDLSSYHYRAWLASKEIQVVRDAQDTEFPEMPGVPFYIYQDGDTYHVISSETGLAIAASGTFGGAVNNAQQRINAAGVAKVQESIDTKRLTDEQKRGAVQAYLGDTPKFMRREGGTIPDNAAPSGDQAAVDELNAGLVRYHKNEQWRNAYVEVGLRNDVSEIGKAIQAGFGKEVVGVLPTEERFNLFTGINYGGRIYVNAAGKVGFVNIAGHELYHQIAFDRPDLHEWFALKARAYYHNLPEYQAKINKAVPKGDPLYTMAEAEEELLADFTGDALADPKFLAALVKDNPSKFQQLLTAVTKWLSNVLSNLSKKDLGSSKYVSDVEALRELLLKVMKANAEGRSAAYISALKKPKFSMEAPQTPDPDQPGGGARIKYRRTETTGDTGRARTPEQVEAFARLGRTVEVPTLKERVADLWKDAGKKLAQGLADQFAPIDALGHKAYSLMRLSKGASGAFEVMLKGGMLKLNEGVYDFDESKRGGVIDRLLTPLQGEADDFLWWVAANRAERLSQEDRERLFTPEDITAMRSLADGETPYDYTLQHGPDKGKVARNRSEVYADALKTFNEFNKNTLDMAEQSGLIDPEARKIWEHEFYVPFYRVDENEGIRGTNIKSGVVRQQAFKQLKGGGGKLHSDLLENTLMNWAHLLEAAAKNRAAKETLQAAEKAGIAHLAGYKEKNTVWYMGEVTRPIPEGQEYQEDGETKISDGTAQIRNIGKVEYKVDDPFIMTALSALEYAGMKGPLMNAMSAFKHALTIGVTASPIFKVRNLIKDSVQSIAVSGLSYNVGQNIKEGFALTHPESDSYFHLLAGGGTIHFATMYEGSESRRVRALVEAGVDDSTILDNEGKFKAFYKRHIEPAINAYNEVGNRGEAINRAALYDQLRKQGVGHDEASLQARDLLDFSMGGAWTSIRFLTQTVPFMNARIQGLYKLGKAYKADTRRFSAILGATALLSVALMLAYSDDDDWKKREDWDRDNYWWFKMGGTAFRIPKPFEIGAIASLAERGVELFASDEMTGKRFKSRLLALLSDNLSMNPIPQLVKPILDVYSNKDSFTGRPIESMGMERVLPDYRFNQHTSMTARSISTAGNAVTQTLDVPFLSPVQVDHLVQGYFSWLGTFIVQAADILARPVTDQPSVATPDYMKLATGGLIRGLPEEQSRYVSQMYTQAREIEQAYGTYRALLKQGDVDGAKEFSAEHQEVMRKIHQAERSKKTAADYNERIRVLERDPSMSADEKRWRINNIKALKEKLARRFSTATP